MSNVIRFGEGFLEFEFRPDWSKVQNLWNLLKSAIQLTLYDTTKADLITMACIELVEHAVRYSKVHKYNDSEIVFRLETAKKEHNENEVTITVENPASEDHIKQIANNIESVMKQSNKKKVYLEKLMLCADSDSEEDNMELGILRVICEAGANVSIDTSKENTLSVKAKFRLKRKM